VVASVLVLGACGGGSGGTPDAMPLPDGAADARGPLFVEKPECNATPLQPFAAGRALIISALGIGAQTDGFDLDGDGRRDNKLAGLGPLARASIEEAFTRFDLVVPFEIADLPAAAADPCVKLAFYVGRLKLDRDGDRRVTMAGGGDCNDLEAAIHPQVAEVAGNGRDDDCSGVADDGGPGDELDRDHDGITVAAGDCDDTLADVGGTAEICGDGLDNDCDGVADRPCNPYDAEEPDRVFIEPISLEAGQPKVLFTSGQVVADGASFRLEAGPSVFSVRVPITGDLSLELNTIGTQVVGELVPVAGALGIRRGRVGGVLDAATLDRVRGLTVEELGLGPEDSLADVIFGPVLGIALALPRNDMGCFMPDIDVDGDGREAFCDTLVDDGKSRVDLCIDGDGREVRDADGVDCTQAKNPDGSLRFTDGISLALTFEAVPASELLLVPVAP
jgi:hypothetical protein